MRAANTLPFTTKANSGYPIRARNALFRFDCLESVVIDLPLWTVRALEPSWVPTILSLPRSHALNFQTDSFPRGVETTSGHEDSSGNRSDSNLSQLFQKTLRFSVQLEGALDELIVFIELLHRGPYCKKMEATVSILVWERCLPAQ